MKKFTIAAVISISLFSLQATAQQEVNETGYRRNPTRTAQTRLEPMINMAAASFRFTGDDKVLTDYSHSVKGLRAGFSFQAGISPSFSLVSDLYYLRKGGKFDDGNPRPPTLPLFAFIPLSFLCWPGYIWVNSI